MPKDLPSDVDTQIAAKHSRPVILFTLTLDAGTLRYAAAQSNLVFPTGGNTYTARAINLANLMWRVEGQIVKGSLQFDDVTGEISAYLQAESFDGKALVIDKVYRDALGNATYYNRLFTGYMEEIETIGPQWAEIPFVNGKPLGRQLLLDTYTPRCNNQFGDTLCNQDGNADLTSLKATGTADSGTTSTLVDNALTQADDYWNYGRAELVYDGDTYYRKIKDFDAASDTVTFDVPLPFAVDNTVTYTLYKGCSFTWDVCQSNQAWGPSGDNKANYRGFMHIGETY